MKWIGYGVLHGDKLIGLDANSGGYPFDVYTFRQIYTWHDANAAKDYARMFGDTYKAVKVTVSVKVEDPE